MTATGRAVFLGGGQLLDRRLDGRNDQRACLGGSRLDVGFAGLGRTVVESAHDRREDGDGRLRRLHLGLLGLLGLGHGRTLDGRHLGDHGGHRPAFLALDRRGDGIQRLLRGRRGFAERDGGHALADQERLVHRRLLLDVVHGRGVRCIQRLIHCQARLGRLRPALDDCRLRFLVRLLLGGHLGLGLLWEHRDHHATERAEGGRDRTAGETSEEPEATPDVPARPSQRGHDLGHSDIGQKNDRGAQHRGGHQGGAHGTDERGHGLSDDLAEETARPTQERLPVGEGQMAKHGDRIDEREESHWLEKPINKRLATTQTHRDNETSADEQV
jgi:hypothetical protein